MEAIARRVGPAASALALALAAAGCFDFSPLEETVATRRHNERTVAAIEARPSPDRLRFAVVGDVQAGFDAADDVVRALNRDADLSFVVQVGDFTDLGLAVEYEAMIGIFRRLRAPWLVVIGNHDHLGNGAEIFEKAFGPRDLAFTFAGTRFVLLDTNSVAFPRGGVPDLAWLAAALSAPPAHDRAVVFAHVWPWAREFDPALVGPYLRLLGDQGVELALYGHLHLYDTRHEGEAEHVTAEHVRSRVYLIVEEDEDGVLRVRRVRA